MLQRNSLLILFDLNQQILYSFIDKISLQLNSFTMEYKYSDNPIENELFNRTHRLMKELEKFLGYNDGVYSFNTHQHLVDEHIYGVGSKKRQIILPMPREKWYPADQCLKLELESIHLAKKWPQISHYTYSMDLLINEFPGMLYFGYAVCGEQLHPCAFFVNFLFTGEIPDSDDKFPEEWVIDPMGIASGKKPECYIGVSPKTEHVENWLLEKKIHPLEAWACEMDAILRKDREFEREINRGHQEIIDSLSPDRQESYVKLLNFY